MARKVKVQTANLWLQDGRERRMMGEVQDPRVEVTEHGLVVQMGFVLVRREIGTLVLERDFLVLGRIEPEEDLEVVEVGFRSSETSEAAAEGLEQYVQQMIVVVGEVLMGEIAMYVMEKTNLAGVEEVG